MLLLEDYLAECVERSKISFNALCEYIEEYFEKIEDPILSDNPEVKKAILDFNNYFLEGKKLPKERIEKRLGHLQGMVERFKRKFLVGSYECTSEFFKDLSENVKYAKGVGPNREKLLKKLDINTLFDLINFFPREYEDRRRIVPLRFLEHGSKVTTTGIFLSVEKVKKSNLSIITAVLSDGFTQVLVKWFNQDYIEQIIKVNLNKRVYVTGTVKTGFFGGKEIHSPEIDFDESPKREILPIYPLTEGISQKVLRNLIKENFNLVCSLEDVIPSELLEKRGLPDLKTAYVGMHFPVSNYHRKISRDRFAYEELLKFKLAQFLIKKKLNETGGIPKVFSGDLAEKFIESLPFKLTNAQIRAHNEIRQDLRSDKPMNRLIHGDVGCGKTLVAELSIIDNFEAGYQSAFMVPTSILALQHFQKLSQHLTPLGMKVGLLLGSLSQKEKNNVKYGLENGYIDVVIGTHALIQEDVKFSNLGLVVIDEQHRFGVKQRQELISKGKVVDTLFMTATPIPRTLSLALYGDLDITAIDELPPGRKEIKTFVKHHTKVMEIYDFIKKKIYDGEQAYIVYPLIEESDKLPVKAAQQMFNALSEKIFNGIRTGLIHGRMSDTEKDEVMRDFKEGNIKILISTSVIEVGVDVPNATIMVIENAERFGLAQLHQLRGRVGRGDKQSYCLLTYGDVDEETKERLLFFASTTDGFKISEYDLQYRGPGEFFGFRQHGETDFKVADIIRDTQQILQATEDAKEILEGQYNSEKLLKSVLETYGNRLELLEIA